MNKGERVADSWFSVSRITYIGTRTKPKKAKRKFFLNEKPETYRCVEGGERKKTVAVTQKKHAAEVDQASSGRKIKH